MLLSYVSLLIGGSLLLGGGQKTPPLTGTVVRLKWVASGVVGRMPVPPKPLTLFPDPAAKVQKIPSGLVTPQYTEITLGPREQPTTFAIALEEPPGGRPARLFVDANANGDFTDDPPIAWQRQPYKANSGKEFFRTTGNATVSVRFGKETLPCGLVFSRYDPTDPERALYRGSLLCQADFAREGELTLNGKTYTAALVDTLSTGDLRGPAGLFFLLDANGNEVYDRRGEAFLLEQPFTIQGVTYELTKLTPSGDSFTLVRSSRKVPEIPPPPDLRVGKKVPPFTMTTLDGKTLRFPTDYKGKLILLHFWAMWCGDCQLELPTLLSAYAKMHPLGVEFVGVSLDMAGMASQLTAFLQEKALTWPQIYDGKQWKAALADLYFVETIPRAILVDGDTGQIVEEETALRGSKLEAALLKVVANRKGGSRP